MEDFGTVHYKKKKKKPLSCCRQSLTSYLVRVQKTRMPREMQVVQVWTMRFQRERPLEES